MSYNPQNWAKRLIADKIKPHQLISEAYKETLRFMLGTFGTLTNITPENKVIEVPCINATAERAVAKLFQDNNIILPIVTIAHMNSEDDTLRRRPSDLVLAEKYWDEDKRRALRVVTLAPRALNILYDINVWTKFSEDMDQLVEQIRLIFSPNLNVQTKYSNSTAAFITEESNDSVLVVADREDRILRRKFSISVEGYIPYPKYLVTSTGEITELNTEIQIVNEDVSVTATSFDASSINISETESYIQK
jgi:hypothetical protein